LPTLAGRSFRISFDYQSPTFNPFCLCKEEEIDMTALQPTLNATSRFGIERAQPKAAGNAAQAVSSKIWLAVAGATLGAFMAVLNIQIVNASLADIQGAIGAGIDDGGWISTSYLIAEIVVIPLSGWLAQVFSMRIYLLTNAVLFLALSVACAFAQDLPQMIVLRAIQVFAETAGAAAAAGAVGEMDGSGVEGRLERGHWCLLLLAEAACMGCGVSIIGGVAEGLSGRV